MGIHVLALGVLLMFRVQRMHGNISKLQWKFTDPLFTAKHETRNLTKLLSIRYSFTYFIFIDIGLNVIAAPTDLKVFILCDLPDLWSKMLILQLNKRTKKSSIFDLPVSHISLMPFFTVRFVSLLFWQYTQP